MEVAVSDAQTAINIYTWGLGAAPAAGPSATQGWVGSADAPGRGPGSWLHALLLIPAPPQDLQPLHPHCGAAAGGWQASALSSAHSGIPRGLS